MLHKKFTLFVLLGIQLMYSGYVYSTENCVFEKTYFSEEKYKKNSVVKSVVWEDKYKLAKILTKKGDLISVQHWACNHLGLQAVLFLNSIEMADKRIVVEKIQNLSILLLDSPDKDEVLSKINSIKCLEEKFCRYDMAIENYSEFYIQTERQQESMTVGLKYYKN